MKDKLYQLLKEMLVSRSDVLAAYEGGSKATGFSDQFSDLDLEVICKDDAVEDVFKAIEYLLDEQFGILRSYRIPEPAWHGFSQCFYLIDQMPKHFYLDLAVIKTSIEDKMTDSKRHGKAYMWFDKGRYLVEKDDAEEIMINRAKGMYRRVVSSDFIMMIEIEKNLDRGRYIESLTAYYRFVMNQLGVMMNLKYRPEKVDFGLRYAYRDYPKQDYDMLQTLLKNKDINDLSIHFKSAKTYYLALKENLKSIYE